MFKTTVFAVNIQSGTLSSEEAKASCHLINKSTFINSASPIIPIDSIVYQVL